MRLLLLVLLSPLALGQTIQNPGFETPRDTIQSLPASWRVDQRAGFTVTLDSTLTKTGRYSLTITRTQEGGQPGGFSQSCTATVGQPTMAHLRLVVKTTTPSGTGVWWNAWQDKTNRGFVNLQPQMPLQQTDEWQPIDLIMPVPADVNRFTFGAYLQDKGQAWFDDVRLELIPASVGGPSTRVKDYLRRAMSIVKRHALVSDSIPWLQTQREMLSFARGMQTEQEAYPLINYLLNLMRKYGDRHSFFQAPWAAKQLHADQPDEQGPPPQARYVGNGVGYVAVPRFWAINPTRETAFATQLQGLIQRIDSSNIVSSWVVDLRGNTGGNFWPMAAGLLPLYGRHAKGSYKRRSTVQQPYRLRKAPDRVAVLIDSKTASSGEFTALSFIGLPNVRSFGSPSAGYTTGNADYKMADGSMLFVAVDVGKDRKGKKYPSGIIPDEVIKAPSTAADDPTLEAAKVWLLEK